MESTRVRIDSPGRLHITLIDMHASFSKRVDGGIGLAISEPGVCLNAYKQKSEEITIESNIKSFLSSDISNDIKSTLQHIKEKYNLGGIKIQIEKSMPLHSGFGSKTQTLLSSAVAYLHLYQVEYNINIKFVKIDRRFTRNGNRHYV